MTAGLGAARAATCGGHLGTDQDEDASASEYNGEDRLGTGAKLDRVEVHTHALLETVRLYSTRDLPPVHLHPASFFPAHTCLL